MKIKLQVTTGISVFPFEYDGPVSLGQGPENTLAFPGAAGRELEWKHARIELTPEGAFLSDENSHSGTYLNDKRIDGPARLSLGDRIMLGAGGPLLKVETLDLVRAAPAAGPTPWWQGHPVDASAPSMPVGVALSVAPAPPASPPNPPTAAAVSGNIPAPAAPGSFPVLVAGLAGLAAVVLAAVLAGILVSRRSPPSEQPAPPPDPIVRATPPRPQPAPAVEPPPPLPTPQPKPPIEAPAEVWPRVERKDIGSYSQPPKAPPSVLLERGRDPNQWGRLRPNQRVYTASHLIGLPGYRSSVRLDSGVGLDLWGNIPEFSNFPPILEAAVMLSVPAEGVDLDFTLDRGRVRLSNLKARGSVHVRLRFQREVWDLTLPDANSEVIAENWSVSAVGLERCLGLFVRGTASLRLHDRTLELPNQSRFTWTNTAGAAAAPEVLARLPEWWTDRIAPDNPRRIDMMLALQDYDALLTRTDAVLDGVLTEVRETQVPANRIMGVLFLGALEAQAALVDCLEERAHAEVRGTAAFILRQWIAGGRDRDRELNTILCDRKGYSREKAQLIVQLLHNVPVEDRSKPRTYDRLIGLLNHENLSVRDLAFLQLVMLSPEIAKQVTYRPSDPPEQRVLAIQQWRKLVPEGTVPPAVRGR